MSDDLPNLRDLVLGGDEVAVSNLEQLVREGDLNQVWDQMRSVHRELDREWEEGNLPAERVVELRARLSDLALELGRLAVDMEMRAYREFLRDVTHDIRSPLHSIIFLTEALHSSRPEGRPRAEQRQLGTIYAAGTSLLNLVNDLLDYARIQQGEVEDVSEYAFSLTSVLSDVQQLMGPLVEHQDTELIVECDDGERFVGDPHLLNRVLTNLVSNAVDAAQDGGRVTVRLAREDGGLLGEVTDDGGDGQVGKLRSLLELPPGGTPMTRVRRKLDGSVHGLGLMICSRLVRTVDGWIEVDAVGPAEDGESGTGGSGAEGAEGTRFRFWVPFTPEGSND